MAEASVTSVMPPCLNDEKKPGPTCRPMEKTKRIRPNSLTKWSTGASMVMPKWLRAMPTKRIHVIPSDTPPTFALPSNKPPVIASASVRTAWAIPCSQKRACNQSINEK